MIQSMTAPVITLQFDGGCQPNPGRKYGSFVARLGQVEILKELRFGLGYGTNNEAEWEALEHGLKAVLADMSHGGLDPKCFRIVVETDSKIVAGKLVPKRKVPRPTGKNARTLVMFEYAARCLKLLIQFADFKVQWQGRLSNVLTFGH